MAIPEISALNPISPYFPGGIVTSRGLQPAHFGSVLTRTANPFSNGIKRFPMRKGSRGKFVG